MYTFVVSYRCIAAEKEMSTLSTGMLKPTVTIFINRLLYLKHVTFELS